MVQVCYLCVAIEESAEVVEGILIEELVRVPVRIHINGARCINIIITLKIHEKDVRSCVTCLPVTSEQARRR